MRRNKRLTVTVEERTIMSEVVTSICHYRSFHSVLIPYTSHIATSIQHHNQHPTFPFNNNTSQTSSTNPICNPTQPKRHQRKKNRENKKKKKRKTKLTIMPRTLCPLFSLHTLYQTETHWLSACWNCGQGLCNHWYMCVEPTCHVDVCSTCASEQTSRKRGSGGNCDGERDSDGKGKGNGWRRGSGGGSGGRWHRAKIEEARFCDARVPRWL